MKIRAPIVALVGHVDHGKSSILDFIRKSAIVKGEAGGITQSIKAYNISLEHINSICGCVPKLKIPGILFIDTPGHAAFTNLRKRGGDLADIAVLVIDINEGVKDQTKEVIEILKSYKTPFLIALNKIDLISGWQHRDDDLIKNIGLQSQNVRDKLDKLLYGLVGKLYELGFNAERFDRINDYSKQIALVPVSAKKGEGIKELLIVLIGLTQKYLENTLKITITGSGKGTVLEVREEKVGKILDVILYDGSLKINDQIVIGGLDKAITTKIKSLFLREKKLMKVNEVSAAVNVIVYASDIEDVVAGMPLSSVKDDIEKVKKEIQKEVNEVLIEEYRDGIVVKADSLGALEALVNLLKEKGFKIKRANIGDVSKKDIAEAESAKEDIDKVVLGFNVKGLKEKNVKIIIGDVIYTLIDSLEAWQESEKRELEEKELGGVVRPCKLKIMEGYVFRQSHPAIVGVDILAGVLKNNIPLMKNGNEITQVKGIQHEKKNIGEAEAGKQVAASLPNVTIGRQVNEKDILYSYISENDFRKLKKLKKYLSASEKELLKEIAEIMRKENSMWGV